MALVQTSRSSPPTLRRTARLALGTAQLGLAYGVANAHGRMAVEEGRQLLATARRLGIDTLDTAVAYGDSEQRLGAIGVDDWLVVSKLPGLPASCPDVSAWVWAEVEGSLARLGVPRLHGLLLHRPGDLVGPRGAELWAALEAVRKAGFARKIGISIYSPDELEQIIPQYAVDLVQSPLNLLDRRLVRSGWARRLAWRGVEIHVRSVFLQGLLLMKPRPVAFARWEPLLARWDAWRQAAGHDGLAACLHYAFSVPEVNRVVVGVDSSHQLTEIAAALEGPGGWPEDLWSDDPTLLNPSLWPRSPSA